MSPRSLNISRNMKRSFVRILELVHIFRQTPCCFAGASFLVQARSPHVIFPRIWARKDYAREAHTFG